MATNQPKGRGIPLNEGQNEGLVRTEVVARMLETADQMDEIGTPFVCVVATMIRREAHICEARHLSMVQEGLPDDGAQFLAQDETGFQLAVQAMQSWKISVL